MAVYRVQDSINRILGLKNTWDTGDDEQKKRAAESAKKYYADLERNGYGNVARELQASDSNKSAEIAKRYATAGMTGMRAGLKDGLKKYGITGKAADDLITYNPNTGDVFLGSVNIGRGDAFVDGTNYVYDPKRLDNAVNEWAKNTGTYSLTDRYNRNMDSATGYTGELWNMFKEDRDTANGMHKRANDYLYSDFTGTDAYDAIMNGYRELGEKAGYSSIANTAGGNGGNVDSYAQAQAARQMKSFENAGNAAALDYWQSKVNAILGEAQNYDASRHQNVSDGINIINTRSGLAQQDWNNYQQGRLNDNTLLNDRATRTGTVPIEDIWANYDYFNSDGTLNEKYKDYDFQAAINSTTDPVLKEVLKYAKNLKVNQYPSEYGQYAGTLEAPNLAIDTAAVAKDKRADETERYGIASEERIAYNAQKTIEDQTDAERAANEAELQLKRDKLDSDNKNAEKDRELEREKINAEYGDRNAPITGYTVEDLSSGYTVSGNNVYVSGAANSYGVDKTGAALLRAVAQVADNSGGVLTADNIKEAIQTLAPILKVSDEQVQNVLAYLTVALGAGFLSGGTSSGGDWD